MCKPILCFNLILFLTFRLVLFLEIEPLHVKCVCCLFTQCPSLPNFRYHQTLVSITVRFPERSDFQYSWMPSPVSQNTADDQNDTYFKIVCMFWNIRIISEFTIISSSVLIFSEFSKRQSLSSFIRLQFRNYIHHLESEEGKWGNKIERNIVKTVSMGGLSLTRSVSARAMGSFLPILKFEL
jgi:hypothetical protein